MLIGYVSDQRYVALADVGLEFIDDLENSWETRSRASGAVYLDLPPASYRVILQKTGFGAKISRITLPQHKPVQFRLLADDLLGYAWPKWVRSGEQAEFRVHSVEPFHVELWRYGWKPEHISSLGWHDEHALRAMMQITPDGDYTSTGVRWNTMGYANPMFRPQTTAPERSGLCYFRVSTASGARFAFPWIVAPAAPQNKVAASLPRSPGTPTMGSEGAATTFMPIGFRRYDWAPLPRGRPPYRAARLRAADGRCTRRTWPRSCLRRVAAPALSHRPLTVSRMGASPGCHRDPRTRLRAAALGGCWVAADFRSLWNGNLGNRP